MTAYATALADVEADRERILAIWRTGLAHGGRPEAKLDWYYRAHPEGVPSVVFLLAPGAAQPVGAATLVTRRMRRGDEILTAGVLVDLVVAPEHRSFFPALALQQAMRRLGLASHPLVFGLPNDLSEPIVRRAGYRRVGDIVRSVRVLRSGAYFSRFVPGALGAITGAVVDRLRMAWISLGRRAGGDFAVEWIERPDARFDDLWNRAAPADVLVGVRDARFLAWRFTESPFGNFEFLAVTHARTGELCAYAVARVRDDALYVYDFLVDRAVPGADARLWHELSREGWRRGLATVMVEYLGDPAVAAGIAAAGWVARDRRTLYAAFEGHDALRADTAWYLTRADEDT